VQTSTRNIFIQLSTLTTPYSLTHTSVNAPTQPLIITTSNHLPIQYISTMKFRSPQKIDYQTPNNAVLTSFLPNIIDNMMCDATLQRSSKSEPSPFLNNPIAHVCFLCLVCVPFPQYKQVLAFSNIIRGWSNSVRAQSGVIVVGVYVKTFMTSPL